MAWDVNFWLFRDQPNRVPSGISDRGRHFIFLSSSFATSRPIRRNWPSGAAACRGSTSHADDQRRKKMARLHTHRLIGFPENRCWSGANSGLTAVMTATCHDYDVVKRAMIHGWIFAYGAIRLVAPDDGSAAVTNGTFTRCSLKNHVCSSFVRSTSLTARSFVPSSPS